MSRQEHDSRIDYLEFQALDIEASKVFYGTVFGWRFTDYGPDYTSFEDGRIAGGFEKVERVETGGPLVVIYAVDLDRLRGMVEEHGATIVKEAYNFPGGRRFHFKDVNGNELAVWSES